MIQQNTSKKRAITGHARAQVYDIDPLTDPRWDAFLEWHPHSSVFHSAAWLKALRLSYGYELRALTTSSARKALTNALPYCGVYSWLTGRRLVALPFSDHCEPLIAEPRDLHAFEHYIGQLLTANHLDYVEIRPTSEQPGLSANFYPHQTYYLHQLNLRPDLTSLFGHFHKDSTQRKIRRAEREGLVYRAGRSPELFEAFYLLMLITRRRHHIPPQPAMWFRNLAECFGNALEVHVAFSGSKAVSAILTMRHKDTLTYKYGCSDHNFNSLGGTQMLFWMAIQAAKADGLLKVDLGRSAMSNEGLITFKDRLGASRSTLTYSRNSSGDRVAARSRHTEIRQEQLARQLFRVLPDPLLIWAGNLLYKHIG